MNIPTCLPYQWQHLIGYPCLNSLACGNFEERISGIESRLVDDYDISFVVRTSALNRCSGFIFFINMICNSIFWCTIAQSLCHIPPPLDPQEVLLS